MVRGGLEENESRFFKTSNIVKRNDLKERKREEGRGKREERNQH